MSAATIFTFVKTAWPVISFALSMLSALHASSVHAASVDGSVSVQDQLVHVIGGGSASLITFLAGTVGMFTNHRAAEAAPAKAPLIQVQHVVRAAPARRDEADAGDDEEQDDDDGERGGVDVAHRTASRFAADALSGGSRRFCSWMVSHSASEVIGMKMSR